MDDYGETAEKAIVKFQIVYTLTTEGQISFNLVGTGTKLEVYGLAMFGQKLLDQWFEQQENKRVQPVSIMPLGGFRV